MEKEASKSTKTKKEESKVLSIVALVLGILGAVTCMTGFFSLACCLAGVVVGIIALVKKQPKGMAVAGLVCGALGLIPAALFAFVWGVTGAVINEAVEYAKDPTGYCKAHPDYSECKPATTSGPTPAPTTSSYKPIVNDIYDYMMAEEDDETMTNIPEDDMKGVINDLVVCLEDAGVKVDSIETIEDEDDDNEEAADCREKFADDLFDLAMDNIKIDF